MNEAHMSPGERSAYANGFDDSQRSTEEELKQLNARLEIIADLLEYTYNLLIAKTGAR